MIHFLKETEARRVVAAVAPADASQVARVGVRVTALQLARLNRSILPAVPWVPAKDIVSVVVQELVVLPLNRINFFYVNKRKPIRMA